MPPSPAETCTGSSDTVNLNASVKLALQQAADDTVFNQTSGMSYYPWEASGMAAFGLGSSVPQGWYIQWQDDELSNIPAGGSASATLSITVPSDAAPDFYGYRLTVGSTNGNITSSTVLVVEVEAEPEIATAFLRQNDVFLPGSARSPPPKSPTRATQRSTSIGTSRLPPSQHQTRARARWSQPCPNLHRVRLRRSR